jgi:hypothetical protein
MYQGFGTRLPFPHAFILQYLYRDDWTGCKPSSQAAGATWAASTSRCPRWTRWLPLPRAVVTADDRRRLIRELRDVHYNPQRHLEAASENLAELVAAKQIWIEREPTTAAERYERFRMLRALTEQLRRPLLSREEQLRRELAECERQLRANAVLQRRDYSFCLFPVDILRPFCTQFLSAPDWC